MTIDHESPPAHCQSECFDKTFRFLPHCGSRVHRPAEETNPKLFHRLLRLSHSLQKSEVWAIDGAAAALQENSAWRWNSRRSAVAIGPGLPPPTGLPSIRTTGSTVWLAEVTNAS